MTQGMKVLLETAFKRFHRQGATGLIKLTQSMGGGKTHNMVALGLLAKYPEFRKKVIGDRFKDSHLGQIKVVAFTGRESDAPYGMWGLLPNSWAKKRFLRTIILPCRRSDKQPGLTF